jgi:hypothetical protein
MNLLIMQAFMHKFMKHETLCGRFFPDQLETLSTIVSIVLLEQM